MAETLKNTGKRKGGKPKPQSDGAIVSHDAFRSQIRECQATKKTLDEKIVDQRKAAGVYRAGVKTAKSLGKALSLGDDTILWYLNNYERDPEDIAKETRERNLIAQIMGLPLFAHLGVTESGESVASVVDGEQIAKGRTTGADEDDFDSPEAIEASGYRAVDNKFMRDDNPYPSDSKPDEYEAWNAGWDRRQAEIAASMTPPPGRRASRGAAAFDAEAAGTA